MTSSPSSVSSCAIIEPVQPSPTITTSFLGSTRGMDLSAFRCPIRASKHARGWQRITLVVTIDPVAIIVTGAGEADHFPGDHVPISAVDRVGKEASLDVLNDLLEEILA